jgi:hypothetical protein
MHTSLSVATIGCSKPNGHRRVICWLIGVTTSYETILKQADRPTPIFFSEKCQPDNFYDRLVACARVIRDLVTEDAC